MDELPAVGAVLAQGCVFVLVAVVSHRALGELPFTKGSRALLAGSVAGLATVGVGNVLRSDSLQLVVLPATALAFSLQVVLLLRLLDRDERRIARNRAPSREEAPRRVRELQPPRGRRERD